MNKTIPIIIEKDETGYYVIECPLLSGCYSQGKTLKEAQANFREVLDLVLEEKENRQIWENYQPKSVRFETLTHA
ncbi:type II toxin-antitoxin system HicB family antitoxin [Candidatus Berkelbacteria bacterium]|uniref:HicB-like antitoxin of toxin-antitoxin system domain-containing protein n=1 Tax=Candidatus Berkelbacteria bacterium CG10_big_fil_rev_8_21_14_0_10_43_14 TaxID=1974515 RepID=A0A2M6R7Z6_9BACT|nr:type II toxin-antitoxin system HicB family antitoxin [Candidatus Berkelbacteria bacterium]OIP07018.1 MAG: hypothetical protein AUK41_00825 [Candidatus Berkelbacteria bacterium CG2_30_43_20]PIS06646.1 MAG: hypothetical protein COT79_03525 [Candidatus Berkelbacteria bacterium CG10_big_fil_rev_8_21_14_0_10_43_14]PIU86958.1 MAG: hypothetical protein COS66_03425 [Candidatus Berkelbacteria bacterium CG06_land_8_20_14_3_00_43_10]